ncbi:beta-carotene hydroxylase [Emticicia sp. BO119]|nr:beta-carotene hydroxylase [Emticicia sp. BO119]
MEFMAWFAHKYIMHGFGWNWHKDHHQHHKGFFERNDYYAVVFSIIAASSIIYGNINSDFWFLTWIGTGVTCYGVAYFIFHDIIVHRRVKIKFVAKNKYLKRIMNAHYVHHRVHTKDGAEAFGFLYAPQKYDPKKRE